MWPRSPYQTAVYSVGLGGGGLAAALVGYLRLKGWMLQVELGIACLLTVLSVLAGLNALERRGDEGEMEIPGRMGQTGLLATGGILLAAAGLAVAMYGLLY